MKKISMKKILDSSKVNVPKPGDIPEWGLELEPVRKLPTKTGSKIRNCIYRALEKTPPRWAQKRLKLSISKEVYKGNASGPTKRAVIAVLTDLEQKILQENVRKNKKKMMKKEDEGCIVDSVADLVMKQCRIVLRRVALVDKDGILGDFMKGNNNSVMGSGCLDFVGIDLKLADGSYCGSHEAFFDDVDELWGNIHVAFKEQPDSIKLAEMLCKSFKEMYDNEVLTFVQKTVECASSGEMKGRDDSLARVKESLIPKAPWEGGACKACGMDRDDVNVLLCDGCDSEYHRYCLNPPLAKIPEGNWYCPSCVSGQSMSRSTLSSTGVYSQCKLKEGQELNLLASGMMIKEDGELNRGEGTTCLQCGDVGFDNAYVYCNKCLKFAVHRYCLPEIPKTYDEFVHWVCDDCGAVSLGSARQKDLLNTQDDRFPVHDGVFSS